jgi:hypothetical protein
VPEIHLSLLIKAQILLSGHNSKSVRMSHSTSPALHADNWIALVQYAEFDRIHDTPGQAAIHIYLPGDLVKVWLCFCKVEWIDAAVQVRVLWYS